jgi:hypothetical protein
MSAPNGRAALLEKGWTGLSSWAGENTETGGLARPYDLTGPAWRRTIQLMAERDPIIHGWLLALDTTVRGVSWRVVDNPTNPNPEITEHIRQCLDDMSHSWADTLSEIFSFIPYGWSYHTIVYKRRMGRNPDGRYDSDYDDGRYGWRKIAPRSQNSLDRWQFDQQGGIRGMWQTQEKGDPVLLPIEESLLFRTRSRLNNPEGPSLLTGAHESWKAKWHITRIERIAIERNFVGVPYFFGPPEMWDVNHPQAEFYLLLRKRFEEIGEKFSRNESSYLIMPRMYDPDTKQPLYGMDVIRGGEGMNPDMSKVIQRENLMMLTSLLSDWLVLGQNAVGSFAMARQKTSFFVRTLATFLGHICEVFNAHAIPRLVALNNWNPAESPRLEYGDLTEIDLAGMSQFVERMAKIGVILDKEQINWLLGRADVPPGDPTLPDPRPPAPRVAPAPDDEPGPDDDDDGPPGEDE